MSVEIKGASSIEWEDKKLGRFRLVSFIELFLHLLSWNGSCSSIFLTPSEIGLCIIKLAVLLHPPLHIYTQI